jgi:hypothetical protein
MKRRDFLKGGAGLVTAAIATPASAQISNPQLLESIRLYWCYAHPRLRRNIYTLYNSNPSHPAIVAYRTAVGVMRGRPASDPTSWLYQANIHGTNTPSGSWPAGAPWSTCNHGWQFLAWHRMYLYFFERIVRAASGDPTFALPYWDYAPASNRTLPPPFRTPNNATNPLWDSTRGAMNTGGSLPASAVDSTTCLIPTSYTSFQSSINGTPHGAVHVSIGGNMGGFNTAGQDPIFWLHHCNIDRLWEKWLAQGGGRVNPTSDASWMNTNFTFVDENKNFVQMSGDDVLYTINQLGYQYEDPRTCVPPWWYYLLASEKIILAQLRRSVLASFVVARNLKLTPDQARIDLHTDDSETRERFAKAISLETLNRTINDNGHYTLTFEGVQTDAPLDGYFEVYLGLPRDGKPDPEGPYYAGNLTTFGADAESRRSAKGSHAGHTDFGQQVSIDVSERLKRLVERGDVKNELTVTLVPAGVAKSPNERFAFDAKANPRIDAVVLTIEKDN